MTDQERDAKARRMERLMRRYIEGCNEADVEKMIS